jgi:hypothetical protein
MLTRRDFPIFTSNSFPASSKLINYYRGPFILKYDISDDLCHAAILPQAEKFDVCGYPTWNSAILIPLNFSCERLTQKASSIIYGLIDFYLFIVSALEGKED